MKNSLTAITANNLKDGRVVYLAEKGWVLDVKSALSFTDEATAEAALKKAEGNSHIVGAYIIELDEATNPSSNREQIRAKGPTIHPELGKQANNL